jgi:hypothetical protein
MHNLNPPLEAVSPKSGFMMQTDPAGRQLYHPTGSLEKAPSRIVVAEGLIPRELANTFPPRHAQALL